MNKEDVTFRKINKKICIQVCEQVNPYEEISYYLYFAILNTCSLGMI